jgi:hypothetical protein
MDAMTKTSKSGGCGCGGAGKSGGCGCGPGTPATACACGDVGCATCRNQGFVRPRFFAGQLLTEEDLQKLVDYTVAKNRLHNQRLWGDGVVCGLEVTCHPCGGGTVQVNPGYALDCCGNDLVLSCPQPLDINAMIRDLKRSLRGGIDCGDPCPPPKKNGQATPSQPVPGVPSTPTPAGAAVNPSTTGSSTEPVHEPVDTTRHYCLYIRYCETLTEPVTPYATDEGCSNQSCQPTRVNEGVSFELRCGETCGHAPDIRDRICECIGDLDSAFQATQHSNAFYFASRMQEPVANVVTNDRAAASKSFEAAVSQMKQNRPPAADNTKLVAAGREAGPGEVTPSSGLSVDEFEKWLVDMHAADAHLAGYLLAQSTGGTTTIIVKEAAGEDEVAAARVQLRDAATDLKANVNNVAAPEVARKFYTAALDRTLEVAADQPILEEPRLREIARGSLFVAADYSHAISPAAALREELLDRLDLSPRTGDCRLRFDVESIRIPGLNSSVEENRRALAQLHAAWVRYLKDCICAAFNPPCAPCDDTSVLLACLTVKDCEVVDICNLKRKFVISGPALRYWVPPLNWLGEVLERLCCPDPICEEEEEAVETGRSVADRSGFLRTNTAFGIRQKLPGRVNFGIFQFLCRSVKRTQTFNVPRSSIAPRLSLQNTLNTFGATIAQRIGLPELRLTRTPDIQTRLDTFTDALKNEDIRKLATEVLKIDPARAGEAISAIADEKVNEAVEKLTTDAAKDLKEARTLKKKNTELAQRVEDLTKKLTELSNQVTKLKEGTK